MADRNRYDDSYRRRQDRGEEGFFDQIRGWFRGEDRSRRRAPREEMNRDREPNRWNSESGNWYNRDYNRNQDWERTRQWRPSSDQDYRRGEWDRDTRGFDRYGSGQGTNRDFDYSEGYGRSYNRGSYYGNDRDRDTNWDWDREYRNRDIGRASSAQIYDTDWYDWNFERGFEEDDYNRDPNQFYGYGQNDDWDAQYNNRNRGRGYNRGQGRRGQYGTAGMGSDFEGNSSRQYQSAGMRSDYGYGNKSRGYDYRDYGEDDLDYRRGDIGYDAEGAFYQDLDEPVNYTFYEIWMIPGEFTGMGPKNYKRADERIQEEVCDRLTRHGRIDARNIEIDVRDGDVTLRGSVQNREMKRLAEDTAESISGVGQVNNEIRVQRREEDSRRGAWSQRDQEQGRSWERGRGEYNDREQRARRRENEQIPATGTAGGMVGDTTVGQTSESGLTGSSRAVTAGDADDKRSQLREEMEVIGSNGKVIGRVKEIRATDFLVDRDMARDVYVPFDQIRSVGAQVMLDITDDVVDNQGWENPAIL